MSVREPEVAIVFTPDEWVERLHRHFTDHGGARISAVVLDPELALEERYESLVVSHRWSALTKGLVDAVHDRHRNVLGVSDPDDPRSRHALEQLGVDGIVTSDAGPEEVRRALLALPARLGEAVETPDRPVSGSGRTEPIATAERIVVGGPSGSGSTEVAVHLAGALAERRSTVLVDADEVAPAIATRLALSIEPNVRTAVDAVVHGSGSLDATWIPAGARGASVVVGVPNVAAWPQVRPGEVATVLERLGTSFERVVLDTTSRLEDLGSGRSRYALTRSLVAAADRLVGVGDASPVGIARLLSWSADVWSLDADAELHLLVNRSPRARFAQAELRDEIVHTVPCASIAFAPHDRRIPRVAWSGHLASRGGFVNAIHRLATALG